MQQTLSLPTFKKLSVIPLAAVIFFTISGGPYGLEPLLYYCNGKEIALWLLFFIPLIWNTPIILAVIEMNSMMPLMGGYYQWVKRALGLRWAFYEGWWSWLYTFIDLAIYPNLFIMYAGLFFPQIAAYRVPVCLAFIWICAYINITGIIQVGKTSVMLGILILIPFILLFGAGINYHSFNLHLPAYAFNDHMSYFGMAIFIIIWNFTGWDNVTTYANEVERPATAYLKAASVAFAFIFILYLGIMLIAQKSNISPVELRDNGFPALGLYVAGQWLSIIISVGGMVSSVGLFLAVLLSISRIPEVMAADKLLPAKLNLLHPKYNTPYVSIIICAIIVSFLVMWAFGDLLIIDITLYFAGLFLELLSLVLLRKKEPGAERPFRIPVNTTALVMMITLPVLIYFLALFDIIRTDKDAIKPLGFALLMILSADVVWRIVRLRKDEDVNAEPGRGVVE